MAYRYCPTCDYWYETFEYNVDKSGETICLDGHGAVVGYIQPHRHFETDVSLPYGDCANRAHARAREQGLIA